MREQKEVELVRGNRVWQGELALKPSLNRLNRNSVPERGAQNGNGVIIVIMIMC